MEALTPRTVTVTAADMATITVRELAQACKVARVRRSEVDRLLTAAQDESGDPVATADAVDLWYGLAWQLVRRTEPDTTWATAQTWDVRVVGDMAQDPVDQEADRFRVEVAALTGLPPTEADQITMAELDAYAAIAADGGR